MAPTRSVLITGANSGIGLVTAVHLAAHGYDVLGTVRSAEKAATLQAAAADAGVTVRAVLCDLEDAASCEQLVHDVAGMTGNGPWALVNNAGYAQAGAVEDVDDAAAAAQLSINVLAPARLSRLVLPHMRAAGGGRIVNVSSIAGRVSLPMMGWYCASKHALEALTDALRVEVAPFGVRVSLVEPGSFGTNIWASADDALPAHRTGVYETAYTRSGAVTGNSHRMPDPIWVARAIRLALGSPVPLPRYLVGVDAVGGVLARTVLPTTVFDALKGATVGLSDVPGAGSAAAALQPAAAGLRSVGGAVRSAVDGAVEGVVSGAITERFAGLVRRRRGDTGPMGG